ncbi:MAG: hypothetical protein SGPRY_008815 [Prymnesium sp.]
MLPDVISGDLDSIRGDVADYYERVGVQLAKKSEQDTNDFEKCLQWIEHKEAERVGELSIVAVGAFGGRLDQQMANLNMPYKYPGFRDFFLLSEHSVAFVLQPGRRHVQNHTLPLPPLNNDHDDNSMSPHKSRVLFAGSHVIEPNPEAEDGTCGLIPLGGPCVGVRTNGCAPPCISTPRPSAVFGRTQALSPPQGCAGISVAIDRWSLALSSARRMRSSSLE